MLTRFCIATFLLTLINSAHQQTWESNKLASDSSVNTQRFQNKPQWNQNGQFADKGALAQQALLIQPNFKAPVQAIQLQPSAVSTGPFPIRQPTITNNGETIVENLVGGIVFNCLGMPTGHHRDTKYCDVFHACVFGQQRKTYSCPFVGENTYFDDVTRRCEFVRNNPAACSSNAYLSF